MGEGGFASAVSMFNVQGIQAPRRYAVTVCVSGGKKRISTVYVGLAPRELYNEHEK